MQVIKERGRHKSGKHRTKNLWQRDTVGKGVQEQHDYRCHNSRNQASYKAIFEVLLTRFRLHDSVFQYMCNNARDIIPINKIHLHVTHVLKDTIMKTKTRKQ